MAGPTYDVHVTPAALSTRPAPWVLTTPESTVRSYLAWISYAYRIGQADVASATMTTDEEVHVDSYNQYNLEQARVIDQNLQSITFGKPSTEPTCVLLPTKETWTYRYFSIKEAGKPIGGPYTLSYETTYTLVKTGKGWVVASEKAKALGVIK